MGLSRSRQGGLSQVRMCDERKRDVQCGSKPIVPVLELMAFCGWMDQQIDGVGGGRPENGAQCDGKRIENETEPNSRRRRKQKPRRQGVSPPSAVSSVLLNLQPVVFAQAGLLASSSSNGHGSG